MKLCKKCNISKNEDCFHKDKLRSDFLFPYCKDCRRKLNGSKKLIHKIIGYLDGFMIVKRDRYPEILTPNGGRRVHLYVMEKKIGRSIEKGEVVHHIDGNKMNWNIDNLILMKDKHHRIMEGHINMGHAPTVICTTCGKKRSYSNNVIRTKQIIPERYQCSSCYYKSGGPGGRKKLLNV